MGTRGRRIAMLLAGLGLVALVAAGIGFDLGRRWPLARLEHLRARLFGGPPLWRERARTDLPRYEMARALIGDSLYLMGGFWTDDPKATARVERYNLATGTWTRLHDMPIPLTHADAVVLHDTIWLAGGFEGDHPGPATARVWRYIPANDSWLPGPPLPAPRGGGALEAIGDTLHFYGGWLPDRNTDSPDHWVLHPGDTSWRAAPPLPMPRGHLSGASLNGSAYAIGGAIGHDPLPVDVPIVQRFDPLDGSWKELAPLPFPLSHTEPSTAVYDGRILVLAGRSRPAGIDNSDDMLSYDPVSNAWSHLGRLPAHLIGAVGVVYRDTVIFGLGGSNGSDPDNPMIWSRPLRDSWWPEDSVPVPMGEVAGGIIDGKLYLVGSGSRSTAVYDLAKGRWLASPAGSARPAPGDHHAAEVVAGKLWLLGGFGGSSEGAVQVYDPVADRWQVAPAMPFKAGSSASAVIDGKIYVAGGIVGDSTTAQAAVFDPATERWQEIAAMPLPRNHAAAGTDGHRLFVFGGRGPGSGNGNTVANGFDDVQIYDPATNHWIVSDGSPGSPARLPQARGGMGKAAWLNGEFWVMGGETLNGPGAGSGHTYARVDIYNPATNRWRAGPPMMTARHGIFPLVHDGIIVVAGGGTHSGGSESNRVEAIWPRPTPPRD